MSQHDYVKFITAQLVTHMNKTKQQKKLARKKTSDITYSNKWFGLFPFTIKLMFKK